MANCVDGYRGPFSRHGSWLVAWPPTLGLLPDPLRPDPARAA